MKRRWIWVALLCCPAGVAQDDCDIDRDGDGWAACDPGIYPYSGICDCDDDHDYVYPGAVDLCYDDIDQDCDGEDFVDCPDEVVEAHPGDVIVTEVMHNCTLVAETKGQWFEITNVTEDKTFDLEGWSFYDGRQAWAMPEGQHYLIRPGDVVPLGLEPDNAKNGEVHEEIIYTQLFFDTEHGFQIALQRRDKKVVDGVKFSFGPGAFPYIEGHSLSLSRDRYDGELNDDPASWCLSFDAIPFGTDYGTAWNYNPVCPPDRDGDAYTEDVDCDDTNPAINPGTPEDQTNGIDDDCDGEVDEPPAVAPGSVIITEIMYDPFMAEEWDGEWVELYNTTDDPIDLEGWHVGVTIESLDSHIIADTLIVPPHDYVVLGLNDDPSVNGGVEVDYVLPRLGFTNAYHASAGYRDRIWLSYDNVEIDAVAYGDGSFPNHRGYAINLDPSAYDADANDDGHNWCLATHTLLPDPWWWDTGTPGAPNEICPPDDDGDGYRADRDCDDSDPAVHPGGVEVENGKDDDCNGAVDDPPPGPGAVAVSELLIAPIYTLDYYGEYIELINPSTFAYVDVNGWTIRDSYGNIFVIDNGGPMRLPPSSFSLFGRTSELALNGGMDPDYIYGGLFGMSQTGPDDVIVERDGVVIDQVAYDPELGWSIPEGAALELNPLCLTFEAYLYNDAPENWCVAQVEIEPGGDLGTPGHSNTQCR